MRRTSASGATPDGRFKETPAPATKVDGGWLNMIQDELENVVTNPAGGNEALNSGDNGQVLKAILKIVGRASTPDAETLVLGKWIIKTGSWRAGVGSEIEVGIGYLTPFPAGTAITLFFTTAIAFNSSVRDLWNQIDDSGTSTAGFVAKFQSDDAHDMGASGFDWLAIGRTP